MTPERRAKLAKLANDGLDCLEQGVWPPRDEWDAINAIVLWFYCGGTGPGHWEVKDFADGWIRCEDETRARALSAEQSDAAVRFVPFNAPAPLAPSFRTRDELEAATL